MDRILNSFVFLGVFLVSFGSYAQESQAEEARVQSLLWKVHATDSTHESYIFGTIHAISESKFFFPPALGNALKSVDSVMLELDMEDDPSNYLGLMTLEEGTIYDFFTDEQIDTILTVLNEDFGIDSMQFNFMKKFKPIALIGITMAFDLNDEPTVAYEDTITHRAKGLNRKIGGLETAEEQMALFDNLPKEMQAEMVMQSFRDDEESQDINKVLEQAYINQDIETLRLLIDDNSGNLGNHMLAFTDERNKNWIPKIEDAMRQKSTFFGVGAGHLGGTNGVIQLLWKRGYTLSPVQL